MCGIAGIVSFSKKDKDLKSLHLILNEIKHRGPDDEGYTYFSNNNTLVAYGKDTPDSVKNMELRYSPKFDISKINYYLDNPNSIPDRLGNSDLRKKNLPLPPVSIGFGHRRLSIIDLSEKGHQPMCDLSEDYWIVFNGEIYNYKELKEELVQNGQKFVSDTDTEVVLKAYQQWGDNCVNRLKGMWSFVIYNKIANTIFGARDPFGVKPMYYVQNESTFAFCSEIKGLLKLHGFKKEINTSAAFDYLVMDKIEIGSETFFKNIYELKPATTFNLNLTSRKLILKKYYQLKFNSSWRKLPKTTLKNTISLIEKKITTAISSRLNAEVKTGSCLSGGIDSSSIVVNINALLKEKEINPIGKEQEVFTASYPNTKYDESKWAKLVVDQTKTNWNQTFPKAKDFQIQIEELIFAQDIPFGSPTSFTQFKVMELIHQKGVKVTIDGQGADELFGGYSPHFTSGIYNALKAFNLSYVFQSFQTKNGSFTNHKQTITLPLKYFLAKYFPNLFLSILKQSQPELRFLNKKFERKNNSRLDYINDQFSSNLNRLLHFQFTNYGLKHLLRTADRNSMHFGVETRMPFVDDLDLVETIFNISAANKIQKGKSKYLLREAVKNVLPKEIYNRTDKLGFSTPEKEWFKELKPYFKEIIKNQKSDEFVNWEDLNSNFDEVFNHALNTDIKRWWRLINFALWRKVYKI